MHALEIVFWVAALFTAYTYAGYPLLMAAWARFRPRSVRREDREDSVSIILCAHNEAKFIADRLAEMTRLLDESGREGEIIVVSDGSDDGTAEIARGFADRGVRVLEFEQNIGKAAALSAGCAEARYDILVFADVRQRWADDALAKLLRSFADPQVGAVSGGLIIESSPGVMDGVGLYWRIEKWLRRNEGLVHSAIGVSGAICAVRRSLFHGIPAGTILDDVYWPLQVVMQGYRVVCDHEARAFDRLPERPRDEFRRKVRTLSGNFQLLARLPNAASPLHNPVWFQFLSHKVFRLLVPWVLPVMLACGLALATPFYRALLGLQLGLYAVGVIGVLTPLGRHSRIASAAGSFLVLNCAAWLAFWVWISGRAGQSWVKVNYELPAQCPLKTTVPSDC